MADEHVKLANPRLADGHPRQVAHELLTAVGLGFVFYGPGDAVACFQALAQLSPALRDADGHNGSSYLGVIRGRPGIFWLCFQGPNGSAIALCVTSDADVNFTTEHFAERFNDARPPWQWGICTGGGNVHADCARIIDSADVVELHTLPGLQHIPADPSGELPTELAAGLAQRGWEPAGSGLKKDIALIGGGVQTVFVFSRHNQTFGVVTQIGSTLNGVVPERLRARQEAPYIVEAAGDLVVMCEPIEFDDPTATPEYVDAAGNVLVTYAVAPHITLGSQTTPAPPIAQPPPPPTTPAAATPSDLAYSAPTAPLITPPRRAVAPPPPRTYVTPSHPAPTKSPSGPSSQRLIIAVAAIAVIAIAIWAITTNTDKGNTSAGQVPVNEVSPCSSLPALTSQSVDMGQKGLTVATRITPSCSGGDLLTNDGLRVTVVDAAGRDVASGVFDLSSTPVGIADGGTTVPLVFPAGTYWRTPDSIGSSLRMAIHKDGSDHRAPESGAGYSSLTAVKVGVPESGNLDTAADTGLRAIADADRAYIDGHLLDAWQPQLSSKRPGLVAEGITWSPPDIVREYLQLRQRFPGARLVWSGDWPVYGDPSWWVTLAGVAFSSGEQANRWCADQGFDPDHCFAKLLSHTRGATGTTLGRK